MAKIIEDLILRGVLRKSSFEEKNISNYILELDKIIIYIYFFDKEKKFDLFYESKFEVELDSPEDSYNNNQFNDFINCIIKNGIYVTERKAGPILDFFGGKYYDKFIIPGFNYEKKPEEYKLYAKYIKK